MSSLEQEFQQAAVDVKEKLKVKPSDADLLELYALYKQGTVGNCTGDRPGMFNFKERAKYDAWKAKEGLDQDQAKKDYIKKVQELMA